VKYHYFVSNKMSEYSDPQLLIYLVKIQNPIPQYVLGTLPAIATIGATPKSGLVAKLTWLARCLGCPFTGLFYFCNIKSDPVAMSAYWLPSDHFVQDEEIIRYRPVGHHAKVIQPNPKKKKILESWVAEASVLERLSSVVSIYYILLGVILGIFRPITDSCIPNNAYEEWPYIPLALIWTLPAICIRVKVGRVVDKVFPERLALLDGIIVSDHPSLKAQRIRTFFTALASIILPWVVIIPAYYTRPIGFYCRSKYMAILSSIWSFNSFLAYASHVIGEKNVTGHQLMHAWFCFCGCIIAILIALLSLLANHRPFWIDLFGPSCNVPICGSET
jgi:hypothetical protein